MTHSGTVIVEVDSVHGKVPFRLTDVLFIDNLPFNILSLQKLVEGDLIPVYNEIPDKVVLKCNASAMPKKYDAPPRLRGLTGPARSMHTS